jgi:hypothetical protein
MSRWAAIIFRWRHLYWDDLAWSGITISVFTTIGKSEKAQKFRDR